MAFEFAKLKMSLALDDKHNNYRLFPIGVYTMRK